MGWDADALYVAVEVLDDELQSDNAPGSNDAVVIAVANRSAGSPTRGTFSVRLPLALYETKPRRLVVRDGDRFGPVYGTTGVTTESGGVYTAEIRLAWSLFLQIPPQAGQSFPFDVTVVDLDSPEEPTTALRWSGVWQQAPDPGGRLRLAPPPRPGTGAAAGSTVAVLGADRAWFVPGEAGQVVLCTGAPEREPAAWRCWLVLPETPPILLHAQGKWRNKLLHGCAWTCLVPRDAREGVVVAVPGGGRRNRVTTRIETAGKRLPAVVRHYDRFRRWLLDVARSDLHGTKGAAAATYWWHHRDLDRFLAGLERPLGGWPETDKRDVTWLPHGPPRPPGLPGQTPPARRPDLRWLDARLTSFRQELQAVLDNAEKPRSQQGTAVRAYLSVLDDSLQPYSVYVPAGYPKTEGPAGEDLSGGYPLVLKLHGLGGTYSTNDPPDALLGCIVAWPYGRGNTDYKAWGEFDLLRVLTEVQRDYLVDPDRVYLTGFSMGGTGTWQLGVHYPDRFAALAPFCGNADHRAWRSKFGWVDPNPSRLSRMKEYLESLESNTFFAENLKQLPVYCVHGAADDYVPVEHSRLIVGRLRELGYDVIYDEQPDAGHCSFSPGTETKVYRWLLQQRRNPHPRHVVYKTAHLRHRGAYWVRIDAFLDPLRFATIDAQVDESDQVWVTTDNVRRFTLSLKEPLVAPNAPVTLIIDGQVETLPHVPASGTLSRECRVSSARGTRRWSAPTPPSGLVKRAGLEGPLEDAFLSRFLVVYGTQGEGAEDKAGEEEVKRLDAFWFRWAHGHCRVRADTEVTDDDIRESNLILFGNPRSNLWVRKVNEALPVRFSGEGVVVGDRRFDGPDVGLKVVYPNPLNPNRYVAVIGGVTWRGTLDANERFGNWFDWGLFDNRNWFDYGVFDRRTRNPESFLAVGFFDQQWRLDAKTLWLGTELEREKLFPRRVPTGTAEESSTRVVYLSDLKPVAATFEKGALSVDRSFAGRTLHLGDTYYRKGLGVHPNAEITYELDGGFHVFSAWVGPDLEGKRTVPAARANVERVTFDVYGDGELLCRTRTMRWDSKPAFIYLDVSGVHELRLTCSRRDSKRWLFGDWDWADAKVIRDVPPPSSGFAETDCAGVLDLSGCWSLRSFAPGEGIPARAHTQLSEDVADESPSGGSAEYGTGTYGYTDYGSGGESHSPVKLRAEVPGTVQHALRKAGQLHDPYQGKKADEAAWIADQEWWFRRTFKAPANWKGRRVVLELDGVNYAADVWLNGVPVGSLEGMWARGRLDVTRALKCGDDNLLAIRVCAGPISWTHPPHPIRPPKRDSSLSCALIQGLRGTPSLVPLGIWQPIRLRTTGAVSVHDLVATTTSLTTAKATVNLRVTVTNHSDVPQPVTVKGAVYDDGGAETPVSFGDTVELPPHAAKTLTVDVSLASPHIWWPHGLGETPLYSAQVRVLTPAGGISDECGTQFGVRTAAIAPEGYLVVNGRDLRRVRGAFWLPLDLLLNLPSSRYTHFVRLARAAGIQVLRVWAGGLLETNDFYAACDRAGMLVIQDFPVLGDAPADTIRRQFLTDAAGNIRRLRSHPSLLAWCGGADLDLSAPKTASLVAALRNLCAELDPGRPFFAQLPEVGTQSCSVLKDAGSPPARAGSWTFLSLPFMSPSRQAMERYLKPGDYDTEADVWSAHGATPGVLATNPFGADLESNPQADAAGSDNGGYDASPSDAVSSLDAGADLVRRLAVEQFLRSRTRVAEPWKQNEQARFWWQATNPWPQFSPALADWSGLARPAFAVFQAWQSPTAVFGQVSPAVVATGRPLHVSAACRIAGAAFPGTIRQSILSPAGEVLAHHETPVTAPVGNQGLVPVWTWTVPPHQGDRVLFLQTKLVAAGGEERTVDLVPFATRTATHSSPRLPVLWLSRSTGPLQPLFDFLRSVGVSVEVCAPEAMDEGLKGFDETGVLVLDVAAAPRLLPTLLTRCQAGQGLLLYVRPSALTDEVRARLREAVPFAVAERQEGEPPSAVHVVDSAHPLFAGLATTAIPAADLPLAATPLPGSQPLLSAGDNQAVLLETQVGRGRCLFLLADFSTGWGQQLRTGWSGFRPFMVNLLAYVAALPHPQVRRLREAVAAFTPWRPFATLPQTDLDVSASTTDLTLKAGESGSFLVTVTNTGNVIAAFVTLDFKSLTADALVRVGANYICLLPGETRKIPVQITTLSPVLDPTRTELLLSGFNCGTPVTVVTVQIGEARPTPAVSPSPTIPSEENRQTPDYPGRYGNDGGEDYMGAPRENNLVPFTPETTPQGSPGADPW